MNKFFLLLLCALSIVACDNNDVSYKNENEPLSGTGAFRFDSYQPLAAKPLDVFYHIPTGDASNMPILFVFHGNSRNAAEYRDAWISKSNEVGVIIIAPEFSEEEFPGGDAYNLGNVFVDGDHPSPESLNNESVWTFSLIEPLFNKVKALTGNTSETFDVYGHSAGAQFAHRLLMFKPNLPIRAMVAAAAGWYTVPDPSTSFPYGIKDSPLTNTLPSAYFSKKLIIQIGSLDNNPDAPSLRHNAVVDEQGSNRYDRAYYFFNTSKSYAEEMSTDFNWELIETPGTAHEYEPTISQAATLLYE